MPIPFEYILGYEKQRIAFFKQKIRELKDKLLKAPWDFDYAVLVMWAIVMRVGICGGNDN